MIFLSKLLRESIYDNEHRRVGMLRDVCVSLRETFPLITAFVVGGSNHKIIPWSQVQSIEESPIHLTVKQSEIASYIPQDDEILLKRDILDKQIVDTQGFRVVKVNDLKLAQIKKTARLVGVDISLGGVLRRLGMEVPIELLSRVLPIHLNERTITWNYVEPIQMVTMGQPLASAAVGTSGTVPQVQLNVSHSKLADLRPADIADILEQLDVEEASAMLGRLNTEMAADTLSEVEYPLQSELLSELDPERASDLLEMLAPDDAADILAEIPQREAEHLLNLMPLAESQPIRDLLRYDAETAGGIMTPEVLALTEDATVEEVLVYLRRNSAHLEMVYYLYVVGDERRLTGVVSLRELVTAEPATLMRDLMDSDVIKVRVNTDQEEVARIIAKYNLLGVPVIDAENHLVGIVTVDDVIDVIHEEQAEDFSEIAGTDVEESQEEESFSWRTMLTRFGWLAANVAAGFILAFVLHQMFNPSFTVNTALVRILMGNELRTDVESNRLIYLVPMLLLTSGSAGSQALGVAGWRLRSSKGSAFWRSILRELELDTVGGVLSSLLVGVLIWMLFHSLLLSVAVSLSFGCTLLVAFICGLVLPNLLQRLRLRGSLITAPLLDPVIAVISLSFFLIVTPMLVDKLPM